MTEQTNDAKQRKERSPNFPFINLEKALERVKTFYDHERRNSAPVAIAVKRWEYAEKSSGGIQTVAALKSYGLLEDIGRGSERNIKLSDLALQILLPRPDSLERAQAIKQAAMMPKQMADVKEKWPDHAPSDDTLRWYLVREKIFTEEAATEFIKIWNKNKEFSNLYTSDSLDTIRESTDDKPYSPMLEMSQSASGILRDSQVRPAVIKSEKVIGPEGDILLQFSGDPSIETYEFLKDYIELRLKTLARKREKNESQ